MYCASDLAELNHTVDAVLVRCSPGVLAVLLSTKLAVTDSADEVEPDVVDKANTISSTDDLKTPVNSHSARNAGMLGKRAREYAVRRGMGVQEVLLVTWAVSKRVCSTPTSFTSVRVTFSFAAVFRNSLSQI